MIWTAFYDASAFNSDLSKWAVSSVINLQESTSTFNFNSLSPVILFFIVFPFYYNKNYIANIVSIFFFFCICSCLFCSFCIIVIEWFEQHLWVHQRSIVIFRSGRCHAYTPWKKVRTQFFSLIFVLFFNSFPFYYNKNYIANIFSQFSFLFLYIFPLIFLTTSIFFIFFFILNIFNFLFCDLQYFTTVDLNVHYVAVNGTV